MPKGSYSAKQRKLAAVAPPRDKITAADLKKLRSKKKKKRRNEINYTRQKTALAKKFKKKEHHTAKHMELMKRNVGEGKTFTQAHKIAQGR